MFTLSTFEKEIREYSSQHSDISISEALNRFIYNLAVMRPAFDGFNDDVDFRYFGQRWNNLSSDIRVSQKNEMLDTLTKPTRARAGAREYKES